MNKTYFLLTSKQIKQILNFINDNKQYLISDFRLSSFIDIIKHNLIYDGILINIDLDKVNNYINKKITEYIITWTPIGFKIYIRCGKDSELIDITKYEALNKFYTSIKTIMKFDYTYEDLLNIQSFSIMFNHYSGIGVSSCIKCNDTNISLDITDYEDW